MSLLVTNFEYMGLMIADLIILCLIGGFLLNLFELMTDFWNWVFWKLNPKKENKIVGIREPVIYGEDEGD